MTYRDDFENDFRRLQDGDHEALIAEVAVDADPDELWAAAMYALDSVDEEAVPDQRPALRSLREAVAGVHFSTIDEMFNYLIEGPAPPEAFIRQSDLLARIDEALAAWGDGRPPKARERAIVAAVAKVFQADSGHTADDDAGYLRDLLLFVAVFCHQHEVKIPRSYDGLAAWVPTGLKLPFQRRK